MSWLRRLWHPFRTTRGRLSLLQVVVLAIAAVIADFSIYQLVAVPALTAFDSSLYDQLHRIEGKLSVANGTIQVADGSLPGEGADGSAIESIVVDASGGVLASSPKQSLSSSYLVSVANDSARAQQGLTRDGSGPGGVRRRVYAEPLSIGTSPNQVPVEVVVSRSSADLENTTRRLLLTLIFGSLLLLVVGGGLAYWLTSRALRPVGKIAALAQSLSEQDLHRRVDVAAPDDELGDLVRTLNLMLGRLESSFDSLHRFTADASHELRAPLTVITSQVEVALNRPREAADYERVLRRVLEQVQHLTRIADQLLLIARADAGALRPDPVAIDVADFLHELAARWRPVMESRRLDLEVEAPSAGELEADPSLLRRVIDNLLDNASRYGPDLSNVRLGARREDNDWIFEVADEGPGVPPELRSRIFERFARADTARARGGGAGLGLALGAAIAAAHGGSLELAERDGPGATFHLRLPTGTAV